MTAVYCQIIIVSKYRYLLRLLLLDSVFILFVRQQTSYTCFQKYFLQIMYLQLAFTLCCWLLGDEIIGLR